MPGIGKPDAVWRLSEQVNTTFPLTTPEVVVNTVNHYYNTQVDDMEQQVSVNCLLAQIGQKLQGRLRFTTEFLRQIYLAAASRGSANVHDILKKAELETEISIGASTFRSLKNVESSLNEPERTNFCTYLFYAGSCY